MMIESDPRADLAELRAQVRHLADEYDSHLSPIATQAFVKRLRELVGPWPHEEDDDEEEDCDFGETWAESA